MKKKIKTKPLTKPLAKRVAKPLGSVAGRLDFTTKLLEWGAKFGRKKLPWKVADPYAIWVSEVMLQQTQVETVKPYFVKFMGLWPTVEDLAASDEDDVLAAWAGLGYYRRAKFLRTAAQAVVANYKGEMPKTSAGLQCLPGIGRSTAAAISSMAYGERAAIMDGNVVRVLSRRWGYSKNVITAESRAVLWATAEALVDKKRPALYTQSIMDLGALVCVPKAPKCSACPMRTVCVAYATGKPADFPLKLKKDRVVRIELELWRIWCDGVRVAMVKNEKKSGVWQDMLIFAQDDVALRKCKMNVSAVWSLKHSFSHYDLHADVELCLVNKDEFDESVERNGWLALSTKKALAMAVPKPVRDMLLNIGDFQNQALSGKP